MKVKVPINYHICFAWRKYVNHSTDFPITNIYDYLENLIDDHTDVYALKGRRHRCMRVHTQYYRTPATPRSESYHNANRQFP